MRAMPAFSSCGGPEGTGRTEGEGAGGRKVRPRPFRYMGDPAKPGSQSARVPEA
ncbi:hypothetical protein GCM10022221_13820 [Actinocorallia aurea]